MVCGTCNVGHTNPLAVFSIEKLGRCPDCQKIWMARPENDPDYKKFRFDFTLRDYADIYAKTEKEAIEDFESSYEYTDYDFEQVKK